MATFMTMRDFAEESHKSIDRLREYVARENDPLPLRYFDGDRYGFLLVSEIEEWVKRNTTIGKEKATR